MSAPASARTSYPEPRWEDVFREPPELFVVVRPRALKGDRLYGGILRSAIEAARQQSPAVAAHDALVAIENADEVLVGVRPDATERPGDIVLVARGVPASVDPARLADDDGRGLWSPGPSGPVRELVSEGTGDATSVATSLFELPGRTWVIATGDARARAREAFLHPSGRPHPLWAGAPTNVTETHPVEAGSANDNANDSDIAFVRIDGPSLVARIPALRESAGLAPAGRRLRAVTLALPPGPTSTIRATLSYADPSAAASAELALREVVAAVQRAKAAGLTWLGDAQVARSDRNVTLLTPLPADLLGALLHKKPTPLGDLHP
jgi:hypothetical protein